jgi:hypothetical protein
MAERLRKLTPRQEKVIRLYFGLGCQRPHSAQEVARAFGVSLPVIAGTIGAAQKKLAQQGVRSAHLREAARQQAALRQHSVVGSGQESGDQFQGGGRHTHHRHGSR